MIGQPDHAAGNRGGAAEPVLLLDQPDRGTGFVRRQRRGEARCPRTDDQNICLAIDYRTSPVTGLATSLGAWIRRDKPHFG
ncbi:hypothetical protein C8024_10455 [Sphingopyxis sp. BSNA05]|nr:hypothetical protein [Sphingopyxis sp. BSNA05]